VLAQWSDERFGQDGHPVAASLGVANDHLPPLQVQILHAQTDSFHEAHARAIEQPGHQPMHPFDVRKHRAHLRLREDGGQPARLLRAQHVVQPRQFHPQDLLVEKENRRQRLVLRGGRDVALRGESRKEGRYLRGAHIAGMAHPMEDHEAPHPMGISAFRAQTVVPHPDGRAKMLQQARSGIG
jgi:hypothetical protein